MDRTKRRRCKLNQCYCNMLLRRGIRKGGNKRNVADYAARGITVCKEWRKYAPFKKWALENGWREGLQIDRIDNDGNYEPSNCRFVEQADNLLNKRNTVYVNYRGSRVRLHDLWSRSKRLVTYRTFMLRFYDGWSIRRALNTPLLNSLDNLKGRKSK